MSSSVPSRPLSFLPFFAANGVLLFTAMLIAWRTPDALAGGALAGVVVCMCLGALLAVLPFVLNDVREREAAQAARQRELVEAVGATTATASRWGAQWAAAATGLEDAATLASRNIEAAASLPAVFQAKIDAFATRLEQAERTAQGREERAALQETAHALRAEQAVERTAALVAEMERALADFGRVEAGLRERHAAFAATLTEFPAVVAETRIAREALDERIRTAPAHIEAQVEARIDAHADRITTDMARVATDAEARLTATAEALTTRLAEVELALGSLVEQLDRVKTLSVLSAQPAPSAPVVPAALETKPDVRTPVIVEEEKTGIVEPRAASEQPVLAVEVTSAAPPKPPASVCKETIMDPFFIPDNGYSALADAMDAGDSGRSP